jgi:hypothetical protein
MNGLRRFCPWLAGLMLLLIPAAVPARTIVVSSEDCERMAVIDAKAPRLSWANYQLDRGIFTNQYHLNLSGERAFLICFPIDQIPKEQKITKAELLVPMMYLDGEQRLQLRRIVGDWGAGVSHQYRMIRPEKKEWAKPGVADTKLDAVPSTFLRLSGPIRGTTEKTVNVTEDVELWYSGAAANHGWRISHELEGSLLYLLSPVSSYPYGHNPWKLRITYEPAD